MSTIKQACTFLALLLIALCGIMAIGGVLWILDYIFGEPGGFLLFVISAFFIGVGAGVYVDYKNCCGRY